MALLGKLARAAVTTVSAALLCAGFAAAPSASAEPDAQSAGVEVITIEPGEHYGIDSDDIGPLYHNCSSGYICFYQQTGGYGGRCQYSRSNTSAHSICSWSLNRPRSVWNRSNYRVHYYSRTSYYGRIGSTLSGIRGNLAGTYNIRSICFATSSGACPYR